LLAALAGTLASAPAVGAVEPPSPNRLDHPIVDVAALEPAGPDAAPRLLTLTAPDDTGVVRLSILVRDRAWAAVQEYDLDLGENGLIGADVPWLVGLGAASFVLIATDESGDTLLWSFRTDTGAGGDRIGETGGVVIDRTVHDAAAADVDGDGTTELVVATTDDDPCAGTVVDVFRSDPAVRPTGSFRVAGRGLAGGVVGAFDDDPGDDLVAYATTACPAGSVSPAAVGLVAVRLSDGAVLLDHPVPDADESPWRGLPLAADVDGDGRHEVFARDAGELVLLDPARDWARTVVGDEAMPVLFSSGTNAAARETRIAWLEVTGETGAIRSARVASRGSDLVVGASEEIPLEFGSDDQRAAMAAIGLIGSASTQGPGVAWFADVATPGCPVLIVPLAIRSCDEEVLRPGATWVATRPVLILGDDSRRRLLVAGGLGWGDDLLPLAPTPWATAPPGWWRHGPSVPFALSELRAADVTYYRDFPVPRSTMERVAAADRSTNVPGFTGSRVFLRSMPLGEDQPDPEPFETTVGALLVETEEPGRRTVARIAVPPGLESGRDGSVVNVPLGDPTLPDGSPVARWAVTVVPINDWGEVGPSVTGIVERDLVGPSLSLDVPMVTPVWPLPAKLVGASDPDTTVVVDGLGEMELDRRGRFDLVTQLAPWPQTLRLVAIDASGNVTRREVSVIGGVDYRRLPWPAIGAVVLLVVVAISSALGSRRVRAETAGTARRRLGWTWAGGSPEARPARAEADDGPRIEIEDLPPGAGLPRA
jgi:hypothetical protein